MGTIRLQWTPWQPFEARKDPHVVHNWLNDIGEASVDAFRKGMNRRYPPASAPGEWPANRTGDLKRSIRHEVHGNVLTVGTTEIYAVYLRYGTSRMARRKMSDDALREGFSKASKNLGRWVRWTRL